MNYKKHLGEADCILYLCSGNIIRSAFAELYSIYIGIDKSIISAGTTYFNQNITIEARNKLNKLNVDTNLLNKFKPTHISELNLDSYSKIIVIGMKQHHINEFTINKNIIGKYLLSEIDSKKIDIADPYFEGGFDEVFDTIKQYIDKMSILIDHSLKK